MSMALIFRVPTAVRCCMMPGANGVVVARLFLHPPTSKSVAVSPKAKRMRFMREFFPIRRRRFIRFILRWRKSVGNHRQIVERMPVASKIALPMAGPQPDRASPAPAEGRSLRSSRVARFLQVAEPRHAIAGETRIIDAAVFKFDGFEERSAKP